MGRYLIRRFVGMIPTILIIITLSFFIIRIAPGGPFDVERALPEQILQNINEKYHLNDPLWKQYLDYVGNVVQGEFGPSYRYQDHDINFYIANSLPNSLILGSIALFIALIFGLGIGIISAIKQNSWIDYFGMSLAAIGISIPLFVVGPVLMLIFAMKLGWVPTSGWIFDRNGNIQNLQTLILPALTLSFPYFANIARLTRASVLEVLRSDFVRTARAKGLKESVIIGKHVLKGSMLPIVSYLGPAFAGILTGSVVVEQIFRVPGLGKYFVQSSLNRDYTLIMATVIVYSVILIVMNFLADIIYSLLDPRISYT